MVWEGILINEIEIKLLKLWGRLKLNSFTLQVQNRVRMCGKIRLNGSCDKLLTEARRSEIPVSQINAFCDL